MFYCGSFKKQGLFINTKIKSYVLNIIKNHREGISEYDLMKELDAEDFFSISSVDLCGLDDDDGDKEKSSDLLLFHKHFILMHILYTLQDDLSLDGVLLSVSPLKIKIIESVLDELEQGKLKKYESGQEEPSNPLALTEGGKLKDYYLDWENYTSTTDQNIKDMLNSFWKKLLDPDAIVSAFQILELPVTSNQEDIKKSYRKLATIHHPDKGGDEKVFITIQSAFELLRN